MPNMDSNHSISTKRRPLPNWKLRQSLRHALKLPSRTQLTIGLLGGSFNPPHTGHLAISQFSRRCGLDRVLWMVSPGNPLKSHNDLAALDQRLETCRRLTQRCKFITVAAPEQDTGDARSANTVARLQALYPSVSFVWIAGADCLLDLHHWYFWTDLIRRLPILLFNRSPEGRRVATSRAGIRLKMHRQRSHCTLLQKSRKRGPQSPSKRDSKWDPKWAIVRQPLQPARSRNLRAARASAI